MERKRQSKIKLAQLHAFIAVAEHNSFSEAALELEVAQSAVSNAIAALESDLGIVLFSRGRYGAELTPAGERVLTHAQQIVHLQGQILKEANLLRGLQGGKVRLTSIRSVATHLLPTIIAQFQRQFPGITVSVIEQFDEQSIEDDLCKGHADIGFTDDLMTDEFETWEFLQDEFVVLLPLSYTEPPFKLGWEHLKSYPLIVATNGFTSDKYAYEHCARFCRSIQPVYQAKSDSTVVNMVAQGLGVAILPRLAAEPIPPNVEVRSLPIPFFRTIRMAIVANRPLSPHAFAFMESLKSSTGCFNSSSLGRAS
ncbi:MULTISPECIES: LysR family transcriptional regulator [Leptolyngbya]|uniref:Transcriptional regulator n=2 Tax=Leptolyngbya boryana TaxID=1184 RepID=A0A1Z4JNL4_LEPBY|nr:MULTISPECIES: LysR family transcriptional regulator [Leptolyngbya]BAY58344.1 transcriptional regulator [Leptolyngbya boryana NIES-2135]MBD1857544.1 LysR family transcriptional regulator [Leptolyngbya sp. FACHB-1624]MBD2368018.1 LysR family transcriptional regulator [Leptolyngbya sp. FACHB-161]MBD2374542.1 LysR family transcriptional regulator [Leptolyngbya sp. FACHB-238]MBD2398964.1 LysR family transcriptional regulator [Leptolyngbya sp. FACHB-239]